MGRGQDGAGRWWCGGWKSQELDDHVLLLARKPADWFLAPIDMSPEPCLVYGERRRGARGR